MLNLCGVPCLWIAPLWNWNKLKPLFFAVPNGALNRTTLELKRIKSFKTSRIKKSLNRTTLELKQWTRLSWWKWQKTLNRTTLELKHCWPFQWYDCFPLWIAPLWNWNSLSPSFIHTLIIFESHHFGIETWIKLRRGWCNPYLWIAPLWNWNGQAAAINAGAKTLWIAPLWNWNMVIAINISVIFAPFESHHFGIETSHVVCRSATANTLNRTTLELKHNPCPFKSLLIVSLNRTTLELKRFARSCCAFSASTLNRTTLELKHHSWRLKKVFTGCFESHHFGIETFSFNPNSPQSLPLNRTTLELKQTNHHRTCFTKIFESHHFGIETAVDRACYRCTCPLNRTTLELKHKKKG